MRIAGAALSVLFLMAGLAAAADAEEAGQGKKLTISGKIEVETAELVKARTAGASFSDESGFSVPTGHIWYGHTIGTLDLASAPLDYFTVRASFEFRQYMTMFPNMPNIDITVARDRMFGQAYWNAFYIREFQGILSLVNKEALKLEIALGYLPYKYNPEVRDMGEFLFRSGTYPLFLINEYDRPFARLTGLRAGFDYSFGGVKTHLDGLVQLEREIRPYNDVSVGFVGSIKVMDFLEVGGGVDFAHCLPLDSRITSKKNVTTDGQYKYPYLDEDEYLIDSIPDYDTLGMPTGTYTKRYGFYGFQGTKLMARVTVDPVGLVCRLLGDPGREKEGSLVRDIFGKTGGKVYAEYAVIGLKNYPASSNPKYNPLGYRSIGERSPYVLGVHIPVWKLLDECALEMEWWPSYYPDNYFSVMILGNATPTKINNNIGYYDSTTYVPRWLWSVYLKKQVTDHVGLVCQMGRNHQRWEFHPAAGGFYDFETSFVRKDEWGWHLSAVFGF